MNKQEFNRLAAEFLGLDYAGDNNETAMIAYLIEHPHDAAGVPDFYPFNPYDDANDMLLLEKKMQMDTLSESENLWSTAAYINGPIIIKEGKTPHESRRACAEEYLKEWKK